MRRLIFLEIFLALGTFSVSIEAQPWNPLPTLATPTTTLTHARVDTPLQALKYLAQFGYLPVEKYREILRSTVSSVTSSLSSAANSISLDPRKWAQILSDPVVKFAFTLFQEYARLPVTGNFDLTTKAKMNTPRCGNKDLFRFSTADLDFGQLIRKKRYVAGAFKWERRELTYRVTKFSDTSFARDVTLEEVDLAFEMWGNATDLSFIKSSATKVDIELKFARREHGDVEAFDGRGITLAHAFPPGPDIGGDVHFDDDEEWTSGTPRGTNFLYVVLHELGHALGLRHSDVEEAVMYAFARGYEPGLTLHEDDVDGIQSLYGKRQGTRTGESTTSTPTPTTTARVTTTTSTPPLSTREAGAGYPGEDGDLPVSSTTPVSDSDAKPDLCLDSKIDAITALEDGTVYAFKGKYAFKLDPNGGGVKHSDLISYIFHGVPGPIDAALTYDGKTYLFKGKEYWRFVNRKIDGIFPRLISQDFPAIPDNLDAAYTSPEDNVMYFFKGHLYWGFDPGRNPPVLSNYPLPISQWDGLPTKDLDAVFTSPEGPTYFFQGDNYWLFDDKDFQVAEVKPPYPRSARVMWFRCTDFKPSPGDMKKGFLRKALDKVGGLVKGVIGTVDWKVKKLTGWLG